MKRSDVALNPSLSSSGPLILVIVTGLWFGRNSAQESLTPAEERRKQAVTQALNPATGGGFGQPGALNAFLIAMVLFEPGTMRVDNAEHKLPGWLIPQYRQVFAESLPSQTS